MKILRRNRQPISFFLTALMLTWQLEQPLRAANLYWDADATSAGNLVDGTNLGGTGTWDTTTANWWDTSALGAWPNTAADVAIFSGPLSTGAPTLYTVTLGSGLTANKLIFNRGGYTLAGADLTLAGAGAGIYAQLGETASIESKIVGSAGLVKSGGGTVRLAAGNGYTGTTTISNGSLIITDQSALGAVTETSAIVVTGFNPAIGNTGLRSFGGGSLILDGTGGNITISRDLSLQGQGPIGDRGAALISTGVNTLSGTVDMGVAAPGGTFFNTRMIASDGTLNFSGTLNVLGTVATTISNLGGVNQAGASFYNVTGSLAGTGTLEASGGGTLFLNPTDSSGFSGAIRVSGSAASGQSVVRIDSPNVLGTRTGTGSTNAVLDMNGGVLAILMDSPSVLAGGTAANVYGRANSTFFADHTPNSSVKDQTVVFGQLNYAANTTMTFNSRNGYGMSFTTAPVVTGNNPNTFTNNLQGGAQLTFTGNFWSNTDNGAARTMTIGGNGNTTINGSIIATSAAFDHILTKTGTGTLTLLGTASTLDGAINVNGGTVAISDRRAVTNNSSNININGGTLSIIGNNATQANLTFAKVINLSGTTGAATILANQTGTSPGVIFSSDFTATGAGTKTLTLGGTNIGANTIDGAIVQNGTTNLTKIDAGRWVLGGTNTYTGATTISQGTLQMKANAAASTIIADTSAIVFNATNVYAGGTLELIGQASTNNVETLGVLTPTNGSGTVKLTPGSGGTASIVFASLGAVGGGGTVNIVAPTAGDTVKFTTTGITNNIANAGLFYNGSDFAFVPGAGSALRAPNYATDTDFATSATSLTAARSMEITGAGFNNAAVTIDSLRIKGATALNMTGLLTIRTAATANASGGIIQTGGSGSISGTGVTTGGSGALVVNVDGGANSLQLDAPITATTTGGFTKVGLGTLRLGGVNAQTGTISVNEGTVRLIGSGQLGAASAALTIRQDGIVELNGITPATTTGAFNNNGIVRNTSATTDVTFTVGGGNGTGTSNGIIEDGGAGKMSLVKIGTGAQSWLGLSTYTGTTTIGSTGIVSINNLQNGGDPSGIGASSADAGNLIFNGTSATQAYGGLNYTGTTNDATDRLFTFDGGANGGVRIQSNGVNGATSSWTNTGALAFGPNATGNPQGLALGGGSTGDNRFSPIISDNGSDVTSVYKLDAGVWYLEATNTYTGPTTIRGGALYVNTGTSLPTASNLVLDGGSIARTGAFTRTLGTGANQVQFTANAAGGFSAGGSPLTVDWGTGAVWGTGPFLGTGALLLNNSGVAKSDVDVVSGFEITQGVATGLTVSTASSTTITVTAGSTAGLAIGQPISGAGIPAGATIATITSPTSFTISAAATATATGVAATTTAGGYRQVNVGDFTSIGADFGAISGVITGAGSLAKEGVGILNLRGANTYTGQTLVRAGTLVAETLGNSASPGATSVGDSTLGNTNTGAVLLGNGGTAGILEYVGLGEVSDRKISFSGTTGGAQIHADGVGALILTNVVNDVGVGGVKTLNLRGTNAAGNMITSQLSDNGGALNITVDGGAAWILTNGANDYSGTTTIGAGALGIGNDSALGTGNVDLSNGSVFAYGADRTIANPVRLLNNTGPGFMGEYSLTFSSTLQVLAGANNINTLFNNIVAGKSLTFGDVTANAITASRSWTFDGSGETIIGGNFTTSTAFGVPIIKTGDGVLQLNGTASNFNQASQNIDIDRGILRLGASGVIPDGAGFGGVVLSPELANGDTAIFDLNGKTETINGLTMNTDGTAIIDNTSATAASLTFGAADAAVSFGGGTGVYTIQNSGGGALSLTKTGAGTATIPTGVTLTYTGTTNVNGGSMLISSPVNGTTGLSATNGSTLALTGGITTPTAITSLTVDAGATLSLLDGTGTPLSNLTSLSLGGAGTGTVTLNLNVGDSATDTLTLLTTGALTLGNTVTFNLTDAGLSGGTTYTLLNLVDGGITAFGTGSMIQGATPGGFTSMTWTVTDNFVKLTTGTLITGTSYWRGLTDNTWNANANNWSLDKAGTTPAVSIPGAGTNVVFAYDGASGALATTLEQNFKINSLTFEAGASTPTTVTINPGTVSTNRLEIAPLNPAADPTKGIIISAGGPATVTIGVPVKLGGDQTWGVVDAGSVLSLGSLLGEADVTKTGAGRVTLTAAADNTFNSGVTSDITVNAGTLELTNSSALGNTINSNLARVTVNNTAAFYYNGAAGTVANPLTLGGGTLSAGTGNQIYSGTVNVSGNSLINMADSNGPATNAARNITLSGVVSGSGSLTVDSNNTVSSGNQLGGTLTLNNAGNTWTGDLLFNEGTVTLTNAASPSFTTNNVTYNAFGRLNIQGLNGATLTRTGTLTYGAGAIGEFGVDNTGAVVNSDFLVDQSGLVTLGSGGTGGNVRIYLADAFSKLNITGGVILGGNSSISVGGDAAAVATISSVISDGGSGYGLAVNDDAGGWGTTDRTLRLTGLNTFTGNVSLDSGILEYDTVTGISGAASSLGQGTAIAVTNSANLRFIGTTAQSTNRPISSAAGVLTLSANGTGVGTKIDYTGAITIANTADGSNIVLTGAAGSEGVISGGIAETGDAADMTVNGGTWTHQTGTSRIGDQVTVTGANTVFNLDSGLFQVRNDVIVTAGATLNLNGTGVLSFNIPTLSADASLLLRDGAVVNLGANDAVVATEFDRLFLGQDADGATVNLNMSTYNLTTSRLILGERSTLRNGNINGTGTLTVTGGDVDLLEGTINAKLATNGTSTIEKFGFGTVTLKGDNSGLASTGATIVNEGTLILDYTADNNTKVRAASQLDMRGGNLILTGNAGAATSQSVGSFTVGSGGSSTVQLIGGAGQEIVLNLGAITRANSAQDGTVRFILPAGTQTATNGITTTTLNTNGLLGSSGWATVNDGTGTWFATNATNAAGGNIIALVSTAKNDVTTWLTGDQITDTVGGFTGTLDCANINSLRLDAAAGSDLLIAPGGVLNIASGGILVTDNVAGTPTIKGGTLASGAAEIIVTQDSSQTFEIGSRIGTNHAVTKSGAGTLLLTGNNTYTAVTEIQDGTLQVFGENAIGDTSIVTLATNRQSTFQLLADETIGRLQGGQRNTNSDYGIVALGSNTLTINESASTTFAGMFTGSGTIVMNAGNTGNLNMTNVSSGFTGSIVVSGGLFQLSGIGQNNASAVTINKGGAVLFDNNSTTRSGTRILDTTTVTLNSADGTFSGQTIVRGLSIRTDQNANTSETIGALTFNSGTSYLSGEGDVGTGTASSFIIADNFLRNNNATATVRGRALGASSGERNQFKIGNTTNETTFINNLVGGAGAAASKNISIVPWAIGQLNTGTNGALTDNDMGNSLVTYGVGTGLRPLDLAEYNTYAAAGVTDNTRESLAANLTGLTTKTINSLVIDNVANAALGVTGAGPGNTLTNTSGAFLFTVSSSVASTAYGTTLSGFDDGIMVGATNEYVISVVNPSSAATTALLTATISSPLTSTADITKSGRGTLILTQVNTAGGASKKTSINEGILEIADLDNIGGGTGGLVFAGGTLRLGLGFADDISTRSISFLTGGGALDTNGIDTTLAGSLGTGSGSFTKIGLGNLTLNATSARTGATTLTTGIITVGATNALGVGGDLTVGAGATLALGTNSISHGRLTTTGASPLITGTGTISASNGFFLNHTGNTTIDAALAGAGGVVKAQTNVVTLTGASTYSGATEILAGTIIFDTIANVGGGASALGAPTTVETGIIRMGLTTTATTLNYTGAGSNSDRIVAMQGTTGAVTIDADGTGALSLGGVHMVTAGNKTLNLIGASDPSLANTMGEISECGLGVLSLVKSDPSTWVLNATNTYTGSTSLNNGVLRVSAAQNMTGALNFGSANSITTAGTLEVKENASFGSMLAQTNSATNTNHLVVDAGKTITINGNVTLGSGAATSTTLFDATGAGTFAVNNTTASGVTFLVGNSNTNVATADFSGLATMSVGLNPTAGILQVSSTSTTNSTGYGVLKLAQDSTITASALTVGGGGSYNGGAGQINQVQLGTGDTLLQVGTVNIGTGIRDLGSITFQDIAGTLTVRGTDGTSAVPFNMGTGSATTAVALNGNQNTFDVTGHNADLKFSTVNIGTQNRAADLVNVFSFDQGTLDIGTLNASSKGANGFTTTTTINIGGGTVTTGAWTLATASGAGSAVATANLTGGDITFSGNIARGADAAGGGTATGNVNLSGANLDMGGNNIGSTTNQIVFAAESGRLSNLAELNGGLTLTKTTLGTMTLGNGNTFAGGVNVAEGTLLANNTVGSATGSGPVSVDLGATLGGDGIIAPLVNESIIVDGDLFVGMAGATTGADLALTTTGAGSTALNGKVGFDIFSGAGAGDNTAVLGAADLLVLSGPVTLAGTLAIGDPLGLTAWASGDKWKLFDWALVGTPTGTFTNLTGGPIGNFADLPDLSTYDPSLAWDVSDIYFGGTISIVTVPEPGRMMLLFFGLMGLVLRRRRK
ncbi:MAG: autotransporter-associated beta strand repeat-containing protein [Verrucomicrobiaceae bacterium]|nr:autotransporter-associated beta strand repeat-containing protein [Verrucomicrobiaceae bacterium]